MLITQEQVNNYVTRYGIDRIYYYDKSRLYACVACEHITLLDDKIAAQKKVRSEYQYLYVEDKQLFNDMLWTSQRSIMAARHESAMARR